MNQLLNNQYMPKCIHLLFRFLKEKSSTVVRHPSVPGVQTIDTMQRADTGKNEEWIHWHYSDTQWDKPRPAWSRQTEPVILRRATVRTHWASSSSFQFSLKCSDEAHPRLENIWMPIVKKNKIKGYKQKERSNLRWTPGSRVLEPCAVHSHNQTLGLKTAYLQRTNAFWTFIEIN